MTFLIWVVGCEALKSALAEIERLERRSADLHAALRALVALHRGAGGQAVSNWDDAFERAEELLAGGIGAPADVVDEADRKAGRRRAARRWLR